MPTTPWSEIKHKKKYLPTDCTPEEEKILMEALNEVRTDCCLGLPGDECIHRVLSEQCPKSAPFSGCECQSCQSTEDAEADQHTEGV